MVLYSKFFPLVLEIVVDGDGSPSYIVRHANGSVLAILNHTSEVSDFLQDFCIKFVGQPSGSVQSNSVK